MNKPYIHGMLPDVAAKAEAKPAAVEQPQIRYLGDMQRLQPQPGDMFVLTCEQHLDQATAERIKAELSGVLGGAKVLVLDGGMKLGVVQPTQLNVSNVVDVNNTEDLPNQLAQAMDYLRGNVIRSKPPTNV
jgi:pyruvate kinase